MTPRWVWGDLSDVLESSQDSAYISNEAVEHGKYWPQPAHAYVAGKMGIDFHIGVRPDYSDRYSEYFVASVRIAASSRDAPNPCRPSVWPHLGHRQTISKGIDTVGELGLCGRHNQEMHPPVLVYVGESDKFGEGMQLSFAKAVPSVIGLKAIQAIEIGGANVFRDVTPAAIWRREVFKSANFGKLDLSRFGFGGPTTQMSEGQLPHQMIQGGPQVVNGVTDEEWPVIANLYHALDAIDHGPLFSVVFPPKGDRFRIRVASLLNLGAKAIDVLYRMVELGSASRQFDRHAQSSPPAEARSSGAV